jgi:peptidoglycan/LPS O-acetylase OafA/YrhL
VASPYAGVSPGGSDRLPQLDAIRGLAAVAVAVQHFASVVAPPALAGGRSPAWWLRFSPLHILRAGSEAVLCFFLLSGFVLYLSWGRGQTSYAAYALKRLARISLPYAVVMAVAIAVRAAVYAGPIAGLSPWFNRPWRLPLDAGLVAHHLALIGSFQNHQLLPVTWSLVHEVRVSLAFPLLVLLCSRLRAATALGLALAVGAVGLVGGALLRRIGLTEQDYTLTLYVVPAFVVGALMARHRSRLAAGVSSLAPGLRGMLGVGGLLLVTWRWWFFPGLTVIHRVTALDDLLAVAGSAAFVALALGSRRTIGFLTSRPLLACGRASYSLYLVHTLCLLGTVHLLYGRLPLGACLAVAVCLTVVLTGLLHRYVELPCIALGRSIAAAFAPSVQPETAA